jgi:hypothetical protein
MYELMTAASTSSGERIDSERAWEQQVKVSGAARDRGEGSEHVGRRGSALVLER